MANELLELVVKAKTKEEIEEVWNSEAYKKASGIESCLVNITLGFRYLKLRIDGLETKINDLANKINRGANG